MMPSSGPSSARSFSSWRRPSRQLVEARAAIRVGQRPLGRNPASGFEADQPRDRACPCSAAARRPTPARGARRSHSRAAARAWPGSAGSSESSVPGRTPLRSSLAIRMEYLIRSIGLSNGKSYSDVSVRFLCVTTVHCFPSRLLSHLSERLNAASQGSNIFDRPTEVTVLEYNRFRHVLTVTFLRTAPVEINRTLQDICCSARSAARTSRRRSRSCGA